MELWRHKSEKMTYFSSFSRNSSLICSTTLIIKIFYLEVHFVNTKHLTKFREVSDTNDEVMRSSKLRRDVKNWWRHISVKNDGIFSKLCGIYCYVIMMRFVKFHRFSSIHSCLMKIPFLWKQQKTANIDAVVYVSLRQSTQSMVLKITLCKCKYSNRTMYKVSLLHYL